MGIVSVLMETDRVLGIIDGMLSGGWESVENLSILLDSA